MFGIIRQIWTGFICATVQKICPFSLGNRISQLFMVIEYSVRKKGRSHATRPAALWYDQLPNISEF